MTMKKLLGISLALVMLLGSVPLGYSEPLRVQLEQGIEADQIQCDNPNHVLVQRTNGNVACVTEKTSQKMKWEPVSMLSNIVSENPLSAVDVSELNVIPLQETQVSNSPPEDVSLDNLEVTPSIIPKVSEIVYLPIENPTGYWVPIEDRDAFANLITTATGDSIIEKKISHYKTTLGDLYIADYFNILDLPSGNVAYHLDVDADETGYEKFVITFLDKMGFQYDELEYRTLGPEGELYSISNDYGSIKFRFYPYPTFYEHTDRYDVHSVKIHFNGWTNNPELVPTEFPLSKEDALKKIQVFAQQSSEQITKELWNCEFELYKDDEGLDYEVKGWDKLTIVGGIPYYGMQVGMCLHNPHAPMPVHFMNVYDETDTFIVTRGPID